MHALWEGGGRGATLGIGVVAMPLAGQHGVGTKTGKMPVGWVGVRWLDGSWVNGIG